MLLAHHRSSSSKSCRPYLTMLLSTPSAREWTPKLASRDDRVLALHAPALHSPNLCLPRTSPTASQDVTLPSHRGELYLHLPRESQLTARRPLRAFPVRSPTRRRCSPSPKCTISPSSSLAILKVYPLSSCTAVRCVEAATRAGSALLVKGFSADLHVYREEEPMARTLVASIPSCTASCCSTSVAQATPPPLPASRTTPLLISSATWRRSGSTCRLVTAGTSSVAAGVSSEALALAPRSR